MPTLLLLSKNDGVAEVSELDLSICLYEDVVGFDVSMDDVLSVQVNEALKRLVQTVLAEFFRVLALEFLKHRGEGSSIHELHKDPEAVLEIKGFVTLND